MNVLDFKKDVGLWHGILTVSMFFYFVRVYENKLT